MIYQTDIHTANSSEDFRAKIDFKLSKILYFENTNIRDIYIDKLKRLKEEDFNEIKIPKFNYSVSRNKVTCVIDFIKGLYVSTPEQRTLIYRDIVCRDSDWTFSDYRDANFVVEDGTNIIFSVDFQSYRFHPNKEQRKSSWFNHIESLRWLKQNL